MKILYFLDSSFPTVKAYGVTTTRSIEEILKLGHEVTLVCHASTLQFPSSFGQKCVVINLRQSSINQWFRRVAFSKSGLIGKIAWHLSSTLSLIENSKTLISIEPDIIWSREVPVRFLTKRHPNAISIVEIHNKLTRRKIKRIKAILHSRILLCPISRCLEGELNGIFHQFKIIYSPMGIYGYRELGEIENLNYELEKKFSDKFYRMGYFGKLAPSGYSKGFEDLFLFANLLSNLQIHFKLYFVGIVDSEKSRLLESMRMHGITMENVEIISQVSHGISLALMERCDVLVLPKNKDPNYVGFPLKALEYAYSGKTILAATSPTNRDVFVSSFQPIWYNSNEKESMLDAVEKSLLGRNMKSSQHEGIEYAKSFSWNARTSRILAAAVELDNN